MLLAAEDPFVSEKIRALHSPALDHGNVHALGRFVMQDLTVAGDGLLIHAGALLESPSLLPDYVRRVVSDSDVAVELSKPERVIEGPLVVFMGHGPYVYGHVLLEMLPKVELLCAATGRRPRDFRYLVSTSAAGWFGGLLEAALGLTADLFETYDPRVERVRLTHAIVPTLCVTPNHLHPASAPLFDRLGACARAAGSELPKRVFVSRRAFSNGASTPRLCRNEEEIVHIARGLGLTPVNPEALTFPQQVALFSGLEIGVGVFGSGLHNAVFCRAGATIGTIGYLNYIQSGIAGLRGLRQAYLMPAQPVDSPEGFDVDPRLFRQWLTAVLAQSGASRPRRWSLPQLVRRALAP